MNKHNMKLITKYFECIKNGSKKIELRLNDEKRKNIKVGDVIIFEDVSDSKRHIETIVTNMYYENTFENILDKFDIRLFGDKDTTKEELLNALNNIYSKNEQKEYGVVGIEIKLNNKSINK